MANTYKNIVITPNRGSSNDDPKIVFSGGDATTNTDVTLRVYTGSNGTLSFEGTAGQLFSITNDLSNSIFSVNDVSGIPSIDVNANGNISLAPYNGKVGIGTLSPIANLHVIGSANVTSNATFGNYVFVGTPAATANGLVDIRATSSTPGPALYIKNTWDTINDALDKGLVIDSVGGGQPYLFTIRSGGSPVVRYHNYTGATEFWTSGSMRATTYKFNVDTDGYIDSPADGTITIGTNNSERMRIDSSGRVGIGTTSPSVPLQIAKNVGDAIQVSFYDGTGGGNRRIEFNPYSNRITAGVGGSYYTSLNFMLRGFYVTDDNTGNQVFNVNNGVARVNEIDSGGVAGVAYSPLTLFSNFYPANSTAPAIYLSTFDTGGGAISRMHIYNGDSGKIVLQPTAGNVGIANTAPEARLHVYGANNASTALKVTTPGSDNAVTRKGVEVVPTGGPNSTYYGFYADVVGHSANYGLYINNGRAYIKDLTDMLGNARITGVRDSNYGTLQIGDTTSGSGAGLGGRITFWGDTVGQGSARNAFAGIKGVKENGTYFNLLGALIFETQTDNSTGDGTTLTEKMRITSGGNVGIGTTSPATQFHQKSLSANNYNNKIFRIDSNTDSRIATVTGDGRVFIGSDNGYNVVFSVDNKGEKKDSSYTMLIKDSYNLLMTSSGFVTDSPNFSLGANNFGATIEFVSPAQNGMLTINKANTSIGRGNQSGTPDKTLRVYTQLSLPTTFRVQESDSQGSVESFGVYANNDSTARLVVANGRVGVGTSSPSYLFHLSSSSASPSGDIARFESPVTSGGFTTVSFRHNVSGGADVTTAIGADGSKGWVGTTSNTDFALFSNFTEKMRITSGGNVGIGTTSPTTKLDLRFGTAGTTLRSQIYHTDNTDATSHSILQIMTGGASGGDPHIFFGVAGVGGSGWNIGLDNSDGDKFKISGPFGDVGGLGTSDRFVIDSSGYVGIGNTSPTHKLEVEGTGRFGGTVDVDSANPVQLRLKDTSASSPYWVVKSSSGRFTVGEEGVADHFSIVKTTGKVAIGTTTPSVTLTVVNDSGSQITARQGTGTGVSLRGYYPSVGFNTWNYGATDYYVGNGYASQIALDPNSGSLEYSIWPSSNSGNTTPAATTRLTIDANGKIGIGTTTPTALLDINTDIIRIRTSKTPASATATGNQGDICWDSSYIYVCTAANTWVRANLSTW